MGGEPFRPNITRCHAGQTALRFSISHSVINGQHRYHDPAGGQRDGKTPARFSTRIVRTATAGRRSLPR